MTNTIRRALRAVGCVAMAAFVAGSCQATSEASKAPRPATGDPSPTARSSQPAASPTASSPAPSPQTPGRAEWRAAAPMLHGRVGFDAVVLGDGTVLAVGDDHACYPGGAIPGSELVERYDPATDAWAASESLNKPRKLPATVVLRDGSAMVIGGLNEEDFPFSSTKIFGPDTSSWSDGALMDRAVAEPRAAAIDEGRVLVVGDYRVGRRQPTWIYDHRKSTWTSSASLPPNVSVQMLIDLTDDRVLMTGFDGTDSDPAPVAYVYGPSRDAWTKVGSPRGLGYTLVAIANGDAMAIGGEDGGELMGGDGSVVRWVDRFDSGSGRWVPVAPLSKPRVGSAAAALRDGRILVAGGATKQGDLGRAGVVTQTTEIYSPTDDRWSAGPDLSEPRQGGDLVPLDDGNVLLVGGNADFNDGGDTPWCPTPLTSVERFTPGT